MKKILLICITLLFLNACQHKPQVDFFTKLSQYCGKTYYGKTVYPDDPGHDFAGKKLEMYVKECTDTEIRVPFKVGEDTSRTWIFTKTDKGLLLKHDHRHADGTPDEITMYGGYANAQKLQADFAADEHTAQLIPDASTNVWSLSFDNENKTFSYYLKRHDKPRYKAVFDLK
jgi:hypothetical protein